MFAAVLIVPDVLRLDRITPFSQLVAFRPVLASAAAAVAVVLGLLAISFRPLWPFAAVLAAVAAVAAVLVVPRTIGRPAPAQGRQYTVLAFNAYVGRADVYALAELIQTERPDLVALPETGARFRARLAPLVRPLGYRIFAADDSSGREVRGMTALAAGALGDVQTCPPNGTSYPHVELGGGALGDLRFVGVHLAPPRAGAVARWRGDLAALGRWCSGDTPVVIAGDLNATLDHSALREAMRGCSDAAAERGAGLIGTWPSNRPRWLAPQIDHVLVTDGIATQSFDVIDIPGSDHRAVLTRLVVPERLGDLASRPG